MELKIVLWNNPTLLLLINSQWRITFDYLHQKDHISLLLVQEIEESFCLKYHPNWVYRAN